jgi:ribosome-associated toxin RatA of RatAB toxin-antitoxin module
MDSIKFTASIIIEESAEKAFDFTQDYSKRLHWDPFLKKAELMGGAEKAGKGVKAYCVARNGLGMVTEYVTYNRPRVTAVKMTSGPWIFKSFVGSWTFKALEAEKTEVVFLYSFSIRKPLEFIAFIIRKHLQNNIKNRLIDLKYAIEKNKLQKNKTNFS